MHWSKLSPQPLFWLCSTLGLAELDRVVCDSSPVLSFLFSWREGQRWLSSLCWEEQAERSVGKMLQPLQLWEQVTDQERVERRAEGTLKGRRSDKLMDIVSLY